MSISVSLFWVLDYKADHMTPGHQSPAYLALCLPPPSLSVSVSRSPLYPCPFLSLPGGGRAQCSASRCRLAQAAGSEAEEGTEPAAPGHNHTPGHTRHSQEHSGVESRLLRDSHRQVHIATCSCAQKRTRMQRVTRRHQGISRTHTKKYSSRYRHPWAHIQRKPRATGLQTEAHTFTGAQSKDNRTPLRQGNHTQPHTIGNEEAKT